MKETKARLLKICRGCRDDMHEPDEQELEARVVGYNLDNAYGDQVLPNFIMNGCQEFVVILERRLPGKLMVETFNLATLIALARKAKL